MAGSMAPHVLPPDAKPPAGFSKPVASPADLVAQPPAAGTTPPPDLFSNIGVNPVAVTTGSTPTPAPTPAPAPIASATGSGLAVPMNAPTLGFRADSTGAQMPTAGMRGGPSNTLAQPTRGGAFEAGGAQGILGVAPVGTMDFGAGFPAPKQQTPASSLPVASAEALPSYAGARIPQRPANIFNSSLGAASPNMMPQMPTMGGGKGGGMTAMPRPTQGQFAPLAPQGGFNVNQAAAGALQQAMQGTQAAMGFQAPPTMAVGYTPTTQQVQGQQRAYGYAPAQQRLQGMQTGFGYTPTSQRVMGSQRAQTYDPAQQRMVAQRTGFGYDPAQQQVMGQRTGFGYDPAQARAQQIATTDISQYESPYQQAVIDRTLEDLSGAQEKALNVLGQQATAARAFGGSRQGIAEAETRKGFAEKAAEAVANLRERGFQQAMGAAQFDVGQRAATEAANVAARQQAQQFGATSAQAAQAANVAAQQQVEAANVAARQAAQQFGAGSAQAAQAANVAAQQQIEAQNVASRTAAQQFAAQQRASAQAANIAQRQQVEAANAAAATAAAQYGASSAQAAQAANIARQQQIEAANVAARTGAAQYGAGARTAAEAANIQRAQQVAASNAAAQTAAAQYMAQQRQAAQQQNFANQLAALQARQGAASQLAGLGQQAFGIGQTIQQQQAQQGLLQQGLQQALIDAARQQYAGYIGSPSAALQAPLAALGVTPVPETRTTSSSPGLFNYLQAAAGMGFRPFG